MMVRRLRRKKTSEEWRSFGKHCFRRNEANEFLLFHETNPLLPSGPPYVCAILTLNLPKEENNVSAPRIASSKSLPQAIGKLCDLYVYWYIMYVHRKILSKCYIIFSDSPPPSDLVSFGYSMILLDFWLMPFEKKNAGRTVQARPGHFFFIILFHHPGFMSVQTVYNRRAREEPYSSP